VEGAKNLTGKGKKKGARAKYGIQAFGYGGECIQLMCIYLNDTPPPPRRDCEGRNREVAAI
jgi:hypothetical protein